MWRTVFLGGLGIICSISCGRISFDPVAFYNPYAPPPSYDGSVYVDPYQGMDLDGGFASSLPVCGNGILETREACDGDALGNTTCATFGMTGQLTCAADCQSFDLTGCETPAPIIPVNDGGIPHPDAGTPGNTDPECGNGIIEPPSEICDGEAMPPGLTCDTFQSGATGFLTCLPDCSFVDDSECIEPPPQCRPRNSADDNLFLVETGLYDFFGDTSSSCFACHVNGPGTSFFTYSVYNVDVFRTTVRENAPNYFRPDSHYNDGSSNYGRVLQGNDIPALSILAYKSKLGVVPPADATHNHEFNEFVNSNGSPNALGESLLTFIDFYIHPDEHQICVE